MNNRLMASAILGVVTYTVFPAQAADIVSVSTTVSSFSYKVNDLSATDGITAAITFKPTAGDGLNFNVSDSLTASAIQSRNGNSAVLPGSLFGTGSQSVTVPGVNALASKGGSTITAHAGFTADELSNVLATAPLNLTARQAGDSYLSGVRSTKIEYLQPSAAASGVQGLSYTLAGNTSVTFSAVINTELNMDLSPLVGTAGQARVLSLPVAGNVEMSVVSSLLINPGYGVGAGIQPSYSLIGVINGMLDTSGKFIQYYRNLPLAQETINVTVTNSTSGQVDGQLVFALDNRVLLNVRPVPEPSTYALRGLGLVGLSVVARQRRAKRVH